MQLEKRVFENWNNLKAYLLSKGFVISNGQMRWGAANQTTNCYWSIDDINQTINFVDSDGNNAFPYSLSDFSTGRVTGVVFLPLRDGGCVLNITPLNSGATAGDITLDCTLNFTGTPPNITLNEDLPQNGLIVCTPAEEDGYWRHSWRDSIHLQKSDSSDYFIKPNFKWVIDNGQQNVLSAKEIPAVQRWVVSNMVTLTQTLLADGFWSQYIYTQVLGENQGPGQIIKINGQKFISFFNSNLEGEDGSEAGTPSLPYRCPCFPLAQTEPTVNDHYSTQEFSSSKTYQVGDYCIHGGRLYICTTAIPTPEVWDETHWEITTVSIELLKN